MQIKVSSIFVDDQAQALVFYTEMLGFVKRTDIDLGEYRWLTVAESADSPVELLLEPNAHSAAIVYQRAIYEDGIPATVFHSNDMDMDYQSLSGKGVSFKDRPTNAGDHRIAIFDDTCGNWIQLVQPL